MKIRIYNREKDFPEVRRWALDQFNVDPRPEMFPETTFIAESSFGVQAGVLAVLLTNSKHYCIPELLLTNVDLSPKVRNAAITALAQHAKVFAKALGYHGLFCLAPTPSLTRRFKRLGYVPTLDKVTTMYQDLGGRN